MPVDLDNLFEDGAGRPLQLDASLFIDKGGIGEVYAHPSDPGSCVKLYISERSARLHALKLPDMIAQPPDNTTTSARQGSVQQLAWPIDTVSRNGVFAGFIMPRLPMHETWEFAKLDHPIKRTRYGTPDSLEYRLTLVRNLAMVLSGMHQKGHFVIDLQPKNILAYQWRETAKTPRSGFVALIDSDGFSIAGRPGSGIRHDAVALFPEIACPRAINRLNPTKTDISRLVGFERQQDLWAFAMIAFRMLNAGLWAWDGLPKPGRTIPPTPSERIIDLDRNYAFGRYANADFDAPKTSRHQWFDLRLLSLFERTFTTSSQEPTLAEWGKTLDALLESKYRCDKSSSHWKLGDRCGECEIAALGAAHVAVPAGQAPLTGQTISAGHGGQRTTSGQGGQISRPYGQQRPSPPAKPNTWLIGAGAVALSVAAAFGTGLINIPLAVSTPSTSVSPMATGNPSSSEPALPLKWERTMALNPYMLTEYLAIPQNDYWRTKPAMSELLSRANMVNTGNAVIVECTYAGSGYDRSERYWYKTRPAAANEGELAAFQPDHLFLSIRPPVDSCPAYWQGSDESWEIKRNLGASRRAQAKREVDFTEVRPGSGENPTIKDSVQISFVGRTPDGRIVDRGTSVLQDIGDAGPPMAVAFQRMQRGGTYAVTLSPQLEGDRFRSAFRPAGSIVRYEMTLNDFVPETAGLANLDAATAQGIREDRPGTESYATFVGQWRGTYVCRGLTTGVFLELTRQGRAVTGTFSFFPTSSSERQVLAGSYRIAGTAQPGSQELLVMPTGWISRPAGYRWLPAKLRMGTSDGAMTGDFPGTGECSNLRVARTSGGPPASATARQNPPARPPSSARVAQPAPAARYSREPGSARQRQERRPLMPQLPPDEFQRR